MHDDAGHEVQPNARHRDRRIDAGLLDEAGVECHPAESGRGQLARERRRDLRQQGRTGRQAGFYRTHDRERGAHEREDRRDHGRTEPPPVGISDSVDDVADVAELWDQEIGREGECGDHEDGAPVETLELREFGRGGDAALFDRLAEFVEQVRLLFEGGTRRTGERAGLEQWERARDRVGAEDFER